MLVVRGDPGVGKTVLLDYLAERARGCRIARATGVQSEMELAFAGLHQLCVSNSVLGNGLGRPRDAMAAAERAIAYHGDMGFSKWALVELVEAAVHSGMTETAAGAYRRLLAMTGPAGTDWALGLAARSRALLSDGDEAEGSYREAIDRLGRTRLRVELARAHLLYGEWLRRDNRRADARTQLRTAHEMLDAMGLAAFAERARRELAATGETARAHRRYGHRADRAGGLHRPAGLRRPHQRGGRAGRRDPRWLRRPVLPERSPTTDLRRAAGDRLYAFDDLCTCAGHACPLSGGLLAGTTITCQCHGSEFDVTTGAVVSGPAAQPLNVYDVQVADGGIRIRA